MLEAWLGWVARCRIPAFVELGRRTRKNLAGIEAALLHNLSNALVESTNTTPGSRPHGLRLQGA